MNSRSQLNGTIKHLYHWVTSDLLAHEVTKFESSTHIAPTIYYIHGTVDRTGSFSNEAEKLLMGLPPHFSKIHLVSFKDRGMGRDIESFSFQLAHKIMAENDRHVILVGHSRGGLVASWFAENIAAQIGITVHTIAAIASPFGGTDFAIPPFTWYSASVYQMKKNSFFLKTLSEQIRQSRHKYVYFHAENDLLVTKESTHVDSHRDHLILIKGHNHLSVVHAPELLDHLQNKISQIENIDISNRPIKKNNTTLLEELEAALTNIKTDHPLHSAGNNVLENARKTFPREENSIAAKNWRVSLQLATRVIKNPKDIAAIKLLAINARLDAPGKSCRWKKFVDILIILAGAALMICGIAGIPITSGTSLASQLIGGSLLAAGGSALFFHDRRKTLSKAALDLTNTASLIASH